MILEPNNKSPETLKYLHRLISLFQLEITKGLEHENSMLALLPTFITNFPTGKEKGKVAVIDLGGSNLRVGVVKLLGDHLYESNMENHVIPQELKQNVPGRKLFNWIAIKLNEVIKKESKNKCNNNQNEFDGIDDYPREIGFTFSFAIDQHGMKRGRLLNWSKDINLPDVINQDITDLLERELEIVGLKELKVKCLSNDTVSVLVGALYQNSNTDIGVVLGTGTNAAYIESLENIKKPLFRSFQSTDKLKGKSGKMEMENLSRDSSCHSSSISSSFPSQMILNVEWGEYSSGIELLDVDQRIDAKTQNPSSQIFEKMVSGMYLPMLSEDSEMTTELMSIMEKKGNDKFKWISDRSSMMVAMAIVALSQHASENKKEQKRKREKIITTPVFPNKEIITKDPSNENNESKENKNDNKNENSILIAIDGSMFEQYYGFRERIEYWIKELTLDKELEISLFLTKDMSAIGVAAAVLAQK